MRMIYSMGLGAPPWRPPSGSPGLGQFGAIIQAALPALITAGAAAYGSYTQREIAEDVAEAAEERAAREQARADAERAAADAEAKRAAQVIQEDQQAGEGKILGIPQEYLLYGGLGAAATVALVLALR